MIGSILEFIIIHIILLLPTILEAHVIDPLLWWLVGKDKPLSTYLRGLLFIAVGLVIQFTMKDNWGLVAMVLSVAYHFALFPYIINKKLGRKWNYFGKGAYDKKMQTIPIYLIIFFQIIAVLTSLLAYYYLNGTIYQDSTIIFDLPKFY